MTVITDNIIAHYAFKNVNDSTGLGHTLTNVNTVTFISGKVDSAAHFVAASAQKLTTASTDFNLSTTDDWSMNIWVKPVAVNVYQIINNRGGGGDWKEYFLIDNAGNFYRYLGYNIGAVSAGVWTMLTYTYTSGGTNTGTERGYINGVASTPRTGAVPAPNTSIFTIGAADSTYFNGDMAEMTFWKGRAISAAEVTQLWNGGNGIRFPFITPTYDPRNIAGCTNWLAGDVFGSVSGKSDGDAVSSWTDFSGYGNHAVQATGGAQPLYKTGIFNGLPVLRFDGSDDTLICPLPANSGAVTYFIVAKKRSTPSFATAGLANFTANLSTPTDYCCLCAHTAAGQAFGYFLNSGAGFETLGGVVTDLSVLTMDYASVSSLSFYNNGGSVHTFDPWDSFSGQTGMMFAAPVAATTDWDIAEFIAYNSALGSTDRAAVENYLGLKYGLISVATPPRARIMPRVAVQRAATR